MARFVGGYRSRRTGGWFRHDGQTVDYLQAMTDGWWTTAEPNFNISGEAAGKGLIEGSTTMWFYIDEGEVETIGKGLINADFFIQQSIPISGDVLGKGKINSNIFFNLPIRVSGQIFGKGKVFSRLNYSKTNALNPILKAQNVGYASQDCPIAAIEYEGFSPNKIINIQDESDSIYENSNPFYIVENIYLNADTDHYTIHHYPYNDTSSGLIEYLVTDTRSDNQNGQPLFYQYELLYDAHSRSTETLIRNIYKNNENLTNKSAFVVQASNDLISNGADRYSSTNWNLASGQFGSVIKRCRVLLPITFAEQDTFYTIEYDKVVNGVISYQRELVELKPIYNKTTDYGISESGLFLRPSSRISNSQSLMLIKNPQFRVNPIEITTLKDQSSFVSYVSDAASSWNIRLNIGSFLRPSGFYTEESEEFYYLPNTNTSGQMPISNVKPELINNNILKVRAFPIYVDTQAGAFSYPDYKIPLYDPAYPYLSDTEGKIAIVVNGRVREDIKILSIDREKGYMMLDKDLAPTDEIEVSYYMENDSSLVVENLELNPKINDNTTLYHVSGFMKGLGLALRPYDGTEQSTYPYVYDTTVDELFRTVYSLPPIGGAAVSLPWSGYNFFTIAELSINRLSKDIVKLTDARKVGGGVDTELIQDWFIKNYGGSYKIHESEWYTTNGYYDGEPLAANGAIIIHVPETNLEALKQKWINYYTSVLDSYEAAIKKGTKEFNYYLDQTIKRYISAGSDYILLPTLSGETTDILTLD